GLGPETTIVRARGGNGRFGLPAEPMLGRGWLARASQAAEGLARGSNGLLRRTPSRGGALRELVASELWLALVDEGGQAFLRVLAREELAEGVGLGVQAGLVVASQRPVDELLGDAKRDRALGREQLGRLARLLQHRVVHGVDEPDAQSLLGVHGAAREDELLGHARAANAGKSLRAPPAGNEAQVDLRLTQLRRARRVADVARERELAAAAEGEPVHRRDRRLRHRLEQPPGLVAERAPRLGFLDVQAA